MKANFDLCRAAVIAATLALAAPGRTARGQASAPMPAAELQAAKRFLAGNLRDPNTTEVALASLRLTGDVDLAGLFVAYSSHPDKRVRLIAVAGLADHKNEQTTAALAERMRSDPAMAIRAQAIAVLIQAKSATAAQFQEAMKCEDEDVQYFAARGLVSLGQGALAAGTLAKLAESKKVNASALSRLDLLSMGKAEQLDPVSRILTDPNTPPIVVGMMLARIQEDKIAPAAAIAEKLADSATDEEVRLHAFRAVAALSPDAAKRLSDELAKNDKTTSQVLLFRMLAGLKDCEAQVRALAKGTLLPAAMARFELSRAAMDASTAQAAADLVAFGHPIILEHLLGMIRADLAKAPDKVDVYTPVLVEMLRKTPEGTGPSTVARQDLCARAATLLGDIGSPNALAGLKEVLAGPFGEPKRAAAGGLVRTKNNAAAELVKPLLESPYPELAATSAICLARHDSRDALKALGHILAHPSRYSPDLVAMTSWYALKLSNEHAAVLQELIKNAK